MPEPDIELDVTSVLVEWGTLRFTGRGQLRLTSEALLVEVAAGGVLSAPYAELRGGGWRTGSLTVHGAAGTAVLESARGLEHAWVSLVEHACPLPELTRGHRLLGSRRGGPVDLQARFLAPFLQARRRLEEEADLDARVTTLDAKALRERLDVTLKTIARDAYPSSHPDRRGLEAELEEVMAPFFHGLEEMESAARHFRSAPESIRFMAWRAWVSSALNVFSLADSGWAGAARLLPGGVKP
ncbi:MAG TPA: hypothetical protein VIK50_04705 [Gemmatimonadaceae bacterium]